MFYFSKLKTITVRKLKWTVLKIHLENSNEKFTKENRTIVTGERNDSEWLGDFDKEQSQ